MTVEEMRAAIRPLMGDKRYRHSLGVEKEAVRLAALYGIDPQKAAVAGILHDCRKEMPLEDALQIVGQSDIMTKINFREQPKLIHGFSASLTLKDFGVDDPDIINAVRYHTVGRRGMSPLEMLIYLADLTEGGRDYPDVDTMRQEAERSLEQGMFYALRYSITKLAKKGQPICYDSWDAYNYYCNATKEDK